MKRTQKKRKDKKVITLENFGPSVVSLSKSEHKLVNPIESNKKRPKNK